jgi:hypothetical protein
MQQLLSIESFFLLILEIGRGGLFDIKSNLAIAPAKAD